MAQLGVQGGGRGCPCLGREFISPSTGGQRGLRMEHPGRILALKKESQCQGSGTSKNLFLSYCKEERSSTRLHDSALPLNQLHGFSGPTRLYLLDGGTHPYLGFFLQLPHGSSSCWVRTCLAWLAARSERPSPLGGSAPGNRWAHVRV